MEGRRRRKPSRQWVHGQMPPGQPPPAPAQPPPPPVDEEPFDAVDADVVEAQELPVERKDGPLRLNPAALTDEVDRAPQRPTREQGGIGEMLDALVGESDDPGDSDDEIDALLEELSGFRAAPTIQHPRPSPGQVQPTAGKTQADNDPQASSTSSQQATSRAAPPGSQNTGAAPATPASGAERTAAPEPSPAPQAQPAKATDNQQAHRPAPKRPSTPGDAQAQGGPGLNETAEVEIVDEAVLQDDWPARDTVSVGVTADFWESLGEEEDEDLSPPPNFTQQPTADFGDPLGSLRQLFRRREEVAGIDEDLIEVARRKAKEHAESGPQVIDPTDPRDSAEAAPLGIAELQEGEEWRPTVYVAARQAYFAGPPALSLISPNLKSDVDELNDALASFAELQPGQKGFIRVSVRSYPEFKELSKEWVLARKFGREPETDKSPLRTALQWGKWLLARFWFEINKSSQTLGGTVPPPRPGEHAGDAKPLPSQLVSDEEKQAWKDASRKASDSAHFETVLRVGVVTKPDDAQEAERIVEEVCGGFEVYKTEHQALVWGEADPYDTCIGFMGVKRPSPVPLPLSAAELGELARVPDDLTTPHGVKIPRSQFKQLSISNPLVVENPYDPKGLIPLGRMKPHTEDEQVIGMRVEELDQHMFFCGRTGTGKSEAMMWMVFGAAKAGYPIVVIDPHGELSENLLSMLVANCPERLEDIVICDLGDAEHPVALNPLDVRSYEEIEPTIGSVKEMLESPQMNLQQAGSPRAMNYAVQALRALAEANLHLKDPETKCTLLHVVTFFLDDEFRRLVMSFCSNVSVQETFDPDTGPFEQMSEKQRVEHVMPVLRAFQQLGNSESFAAVFSAGENRLDFTELISRNSIVIIKLARFNHQRALGKFVGSLVIPYLLSSMDNWGRKYDPDTGEKVGRGCRLFVDEAPTLIGPNSSAIELLAEARKWDLGMIFASQFLEQFDPSVIKSALANTASKLTLALDPKNCAQMASSIAGTSNKITPADIADLPNYHFYGNILLPVENGRATSGVFSAACLPPINRTLTPEHKELREQVRKRSHALICNRRDEVLAKRRRHVEDIKIALREMLQERTLTDSSESPDPLRSMDLGIDLDADI